MSYPAQQWPPRKTRAEQGPGQKGAVGTPRVLLLRTSKGHCDSLALRRGQGTRSLADVQSSSTMRGSALALCSSKGCRGQHSGAGCQGSAAASTSPTNSHTAWQSWGYSGPEPWARRDQGSEGIIRNPSLKSGLPLARSAPVDLVVRATGSSLPE